jgi:hypothetical protein
MRLPPACLQGFSQLGLQATYNDGAGDVERDFLLCWHRFRLEGLWMSLMPGAGAPSAGAAAAAGGQGSQAMLTEMVEMLEGCFPGGAPAGLLRSCVAMLRGQKAARAAAALPSSGLPGRAGPGRRLHAEGSASCSA